MAQRIGTLEQFSFIEGDELHPQRNIDKMSHGTPLCDDDRWDWLNVVREKAIELARRDGSLGVILTCSSLKRTYRDVLRRANEERDVQLFFIFLNVSQSELVRRMENRKGHYMKRSMLDSQLNDLEMPKDGQEDKTFVVDADKNIDETENAVLKIVASLLAKINKESSDA